MYAPTLGVQFNAGSLSGKLYDYQGNEVKVDYPNIVGQLNCRDTFEIETLVKASGIPGLDEQCTS